MANIGLNPCSKVDLGTQKVPESITLSCTWALEPTQCPFPGQFAFIEGGGCLIRMLFALEFDLEQLFGEVCRHPTWKNARTSRPNMCFVRQSLHQERACASISYAAAATAAAEMKFAAHVSPNVGSMRPHDSRSAKILEPYTPIQHSITSQRTPSPSQ